LVNRGTMGVNSLPKTVTRQRRGCDLNPGPSAPESSTLTTRPPSHRCTVGYRKYLKQVAAVLTAKGRIATASYRLALASARYFLLFYKWPVRRPLKIAPSPGGGSGPPSNTAMVP